MRNKLLLFSLFAMQGICCFAAGYDKTLGNVTATSITASSETLSNGTVSATPSQTTDIANKFYVDTVATGLSVRDSVMAATTGTIALSGNVLVDSYTTTAGDRILVKNQSSIANGIYVAAAGAWSRSTDYDQNSETLAGTFVAVTSGTVNQNTQWVMITTGVVLGVSTMTWSKLSQGQSYAAGTGLTLSLNQFSITGIVGAGSCTNCNATFNAQGQATAFSNGSAGGGGSSTLAVGTGTASNFTNNITSPTLAISALGSQFSLTTSGTTSFWQLNGTSVTLQGQSVLSLASATATYFPLISSTTLLSVSSATLNFVSQSSATTNLLPKSTVYVSSANGNPAIAVSNNGTSGSILNFSAISSSVTLYGPNIPPTAISAGTLGTSVLVSSLTAVVAAGTYGSATVSPTIIFNAQGQIIAASSNTISGGSSGGFGQVGNGTIGQNAYYAVNGGTVTGSSNMITNTSSETFNVTTNHLFGLSSSTGVFTSTLTGTQLNIGTITATGLIQSPVFRLFANSNATLSQLNGNSARLVAGGNTNTDLESSTSFGSGADNIVYGRTTAFYPGAEDFNGQDMFAAHQNPGASQNSLPWSAYSASVNGDGLGLNEVYWGLRAKIGEDFFFAIAAGTNTSCGASCFENQPSTPVIVVNVNQASATYGFVGINKSTPIVNLDVNGTIAASTITAQAGLTGVTVSTTLFVVSGSTQPSTINNGLLVTGRVITSTATPIITACGTTPNGSVVGNDIDGKITIGGGVVTSCTMTFGGPAWANAPSCTILSNTSITAPTGSTTTSVFTLGAGATFNGDVIMYHCAGWQ